MQALATYPAAGLIQRRPATSSCRLCATPTDSSSAILRLSISSALVCPVGQPHPPAAFPVPSIGASSRTIVPSALPEGLPHAHLLEVVSSEGVRITQATPGYDSSDALVHKEALEKGLFRITDVVLPEEYKDIIECLQSPYMCSILEDRPLRARDLSLPHAEVIAERIRKHPFFDGCIHQPPTSRVQGLGHHPHQDGAKQSYYKPRHSYGRAKYSSSPSQDHADNGPAPYKYRVALRFSADGYSHSYIDFYTGLDNGSGRLTAEEDSQPFARLEIASGQGYIMSDCIGCRGQGNIFLHDVPSSFYGVSLLIDFVQCRLASPASSSNPAGTYA